MSTKKLLQPKNNLLEQVALHAVCFVGDDAFEILKSELQDNLNKFILEKNDDAKNLLFEDVENIKKFQKTSSEEKRYILTNRSIRNTQVQNALLKILEEPTRNTIIIFVITTADILIPTIKSRVQIINFTKHSDIFDEKIENAIKNLKPREIMDLLTVKKIKQRGNASEKQIADYLAI